MTAANRCSEQNSNKILLKRKQINKTKAIQRDIDLKKEKKGIDPDYTIDPKTGQMYAKRRVIPRNANTGSLGLGRIKNQKRYVDDPVDILSLGADDVESPVADKASRLVPNR